MFVPSPVLQDRTEFEKQVNLNGRTTPNTVTSCWTHLDKSNVLSILSEALTADVEVVFADDTPLVATHPAAEAVITPFRPHTLHPAEHEAHTQPMWRYSSVCTDTYHPREPFPAP